MKPYEEKPSPVDRSRRMAVQQGIGTLITVVLFCRADKAASATTTLLPKTTVQYTDSGAPKGMDCDDCIQFIAGQRPVDMGTCKIVEGVINPHGHCLAFSPKPRS